MHSWLPDVTPLLRLYAAGRRRTLASLDPVETQRRQLLGLVERCAATAFGKAHGFDRIRTVADFQRQVPLRRYEDFWNEWWKGPFPNLKGVTWPDAVPYFAATSGTSTGTTKYIPVTPDMVDSNRRAGLDLLTHHVTNRPRSRVFGGKSFMLGGSTDLRDLKNGSHCGDLSGIAAAELPWYVKPLAFPPRELALLSDWETKVDRLAVAALKEDIRVLSGTPSWLLILFERMAAHRNLRNPRLVDLLPNLELLIHGGVNFDPYLARFRRLLEGSHAETREVYPASEGFIAVADRGHGEGMRMMLDTGLFFEFVPAEELDSPNPTRHWIDTVETGVNYALILTTCAGLFGWIIGDTVRLIDRTPPRLLVTGRTAFYLSAFGEHVVVEELEAAITEASEQQAVNVTDYSVMPVFPDDEGHLGGHLYLVEFEDGQADLRQFAETIDAVLCRRNDDYRDHRAGGKGMLAPEVRPVPAGTFAGWMKSRGKLGGQNKVPRVILDETLKADLLGYVENNLLRLRS